MYSPAATGIAAQAATEIVWAMSGRQFGTCSVTLRPCRRSCYDNGWWLMSRYTSWSNSYSSPLVYGAGRYGFWFDTECGCGAVCGCSRISQVELPAPVNSITTVLLDGAAMPASGYRVDDNRWLVRTDGGRWPRCNDLAKDDTQPGTWSVTALYGQDVPTGGRVAVGEMACEYLKAMNGQDCSLPPGVTQLARQGVTIQIPQPGELFKNGKTGLYTVDAFISSVNPSGLRRRSKVYSVDHRPDRRAGT
jgi:hypothetical protein